MPNQFRLALVGAGLITGGSHLPAALASEKAQVVAIVDPVPQRARELAQMYGITPTIATSIDTVLDQIDGAVVATPNDTHKEIALKCIGAGVAVLVEKPLASTYEDGKAMVQAAAEKGIVVAVGYSTRFRDSVLLLDELLRAGHFGTVLRFAHQYGTAGGWAPLSGYILDRASSGGGVLVVTGTHIIDRVLRFWGYPDEVAYEDDSLGGPEANCTARLRYTSLETPVEGVLRYSKAAGLPSGQIIETDRGFIHLGEGDDAPIVFRSRKTPQLEEIVQRRGATQIPPGTSVFQRQLDDFIDACRSGRQPLVDGRQGLESLRLIEQLYACRRTVNPDWYAGVRAETIA